MLFITCDLDLSDKTRELVRKQIYERTGEDCVFLPKGYFAVTRIKVKKEQPLWKRLLCWAKS